MNALIPLELGARPSSGDSIPDSLSDLARRVARMADWPSLHLHDDIRLDVTETDKGYLVKAELPGVAKENLRVHVDGNYVAISALARQARKASRKHDGERTLLHEMRDGDRSRDFTLPQEVDDKAAEAHLENGVLSLKLPKRVPAASRTIAIK